MWEQIRYGNSDSVKGRRKREQLVLCGQYGPIKSFYPGSACLKKNGSKQSGAGDGKYPGPDDAASDAPANSGKTARSSDADNGAGDRVRGADRNAKGGCADEREPASGFGREAAEGIELGDALAHGLDDAPAARHGSPGDGQVAANNHPVRNDEGLEQTSGDERGGNDAHAFLRVIGAVAETIASGGDELQATEPLI